MSGAAGGTRIPRSAVEQTVKDYTDKILSKIEGFKDAKLSGSFNRPEKEDFGDIDIIVTIETGNTKKEVKKMIGDLFQSLPDSELPPLQNPRYKGKKFINHGEMVSNLYPISGMPGEFVQVDNIISLSQEEGEFKKTILDYPAELQGLILGLVKTPLLEEDPLAVFSRLGIKDIPKAGEDQEYEFHIDTSDLTLRLVTYGENYRILNSNTIWQSKNFNDVQTLLKDYDLKGNFEDIIAKVKTLKNERSKNRVKGFFKKSIKVGAAEKGTPKGDTKQNALDVVAQLEEGFRSNIKNGLRAQQLEEADRDRIAIFPGAFKPPHKDHVSRIIAASEKVGDEGSVTVLVAPSTRAKEGQEAISAEQSLRVFNILKDKNVIPSNVNIIISPEKSPVLAAYKEFEANITQPYIAVFGKDDKARFKNIDDKLPNVTVDSFESAGIGNTSATDLRIALLKRDKEEIAKYIPNGISVEEYLDALELSETLQETAEEVTNLWEPHAAMLARLKKQPQLLKGLWKSLSKPSRKALVLYFRKQNTQTENVIPVENEKAAPYGSGYTLVDEGLWANINAKKKRGEKASHGNSKAFKAAKKAGDALEKTKELKEGGGEKKLRVFDFDDTLVHVDATIHVTHKDGTKSGLSPAEYAVYVPKEGDTFNFSEFSSVIKKAKPLESNIKDLIRSYNDPTEKTTILTARLLGYPVKKYLKDEFNIEPYVVGLGSSDPTDKSRWIEAQIKKGYNNIEFRDDSQKNVDAVAGLKDKYPEISIKSMLVENASYNKDSKVQYKIAELIDHMKAKGMKIEPLPTVEFINGDSENAKEFFGKTAYYDPASSTIVLYTEGRHPKDIVRSFAHEMIHHMQNLEGRLENITTTNTHEDDNLNDLEKEANLKGTMTFRNWTDSLNENIFQKSLDQTEKEALEIAYKTWDRFGGKECNNGFCDIFAKNLAKHLPGSKILSTEDPRNETLGHVWVEHEGKYFDAETPDGVSSWKDLPWMKEFYSKVGSYPTDIETLNENIKNTKKDPFGLNAYAVELARELEEDLIADRIECSNCGWSWKKETGGKSPYLCHKCNHDNTPKLNEGAYDTMTAQVSSDIFKAWKEQFDKDNTVKKATLSKSYDVKNKNGRSIVFDLEADLNFIETEESTYSPNGDADSGDAETYDEEGNVEDTGMDSNIHLYFQVDPRTLPKLWSTISMDLKDIVRHEIEHLTQSGYNVIPSKELPDDQDLRFYIQQLGTMPASNYYLLDKEVPAMLQGLYYKAKKMKRPFKEVAEAYLDIFVDNETIDAEAKADILNRWRPEAKNLNLPSL